MNLEAKLKGKLKELFPNSDERDEVSAVLAEYGKESHEQEPVRVRLAILKLVGQATNIEKIQEFTNIAKGDFRDVLSWAEYPRQSKQWSAKGKQKEKLVSADLKEYEAWLNT